MAALLDHPGVCIVALVCAYFAIDSVATAWQNRARMRVGAELLTAVRLALNVIRSEEAAAQRAAIDGDIKASKERAK
jgi:hypothetical protein